MDYPCLALKCQALCLRRFAAEKRKTPLLSSPTPCLPPAQGGRHHLPRGRGTVSVALRFQEKTLCTEGLDVPEERLLEIGDGFFLGLPFPLGGKVGIRWRVEEYDGPS
jgi:hypothetical protein